MLTDKKVLLVAAHPDDIEIGCGGTVSKYFGRLGTVRSIFFAPCLEDPLNEGILDEFRRAQDCLGVKDVYTHSLPRNRLEDHAQRIRDYLFDLKASYNPDVIICPSYHDLHQDHRAVADCCMTIFRDSATLLSYEVLRSTVDFTPTLFVALSEVDFENKLRALSQYQTQARRSYFSPEIFKAQAMIRGNQVETKLAEAFEIMRMTDR